MNKQQKLEIIKEIFMMVLRVISLPVVLPFVILFYSVFSTEVFIRSYIIHGNLRRAWKRIGKELRNESKGGVVKEINIEFLKDSWCLYDLRQAYYMKRKEIIG